jgi:hypothetical protein
MYKYCPPAWGKREASSPYDMAAMTVSTAVTSHATMNHPGAPRVLAISELTIKIPEPIIDPATIAVESKRPRLF